MYKRQAYAARANAEMRERGIKTIVIDPYYTEEAAKADIWLPIRPMGDIAMLLGWFNYIIANKLYDEQFCKYWTNYPFLVDPDTRLPLKEMCIRDRVHEGGRDLRSARGILCYRLGALPSNGGIGLQRHGGRLGACLLYTSRCV